MTNRFYPELDEKKLKTIYMLYEQDPEYFDAPECPYQTEVKELLKGRAKFHDFDSHKLTELPDGDDLISQINQLNQQLKQYWSEINTSNTTSPADKNTYFRIASSLLEKMIDMKAEVVKIKEYEQFTLLVIDTLDREFDADQRSRFMEKLSSMGGLTEAHNSSNKEKQEKIKTEVTNETDTSAKVFDI